MMRWLLVVLLCGGLREVEPTDPCPPVCVCKWKSGKQTVECTERGLINVPPGIQPENQVLDMTGNNLQILPADMFVRAELLNLQRVYLRSCKIGQIDDRAFYGLSNLVELDLSDNLLTSVPSNMFRDVPSLRDINLAHNPIQKIDSHAFRTVPGLVKLDLSHCELQAIAPMAFDGVELLEALKLNGNRLSQLKHKTVETLSRLHGVELHDNPWHCDCHLRAVKLWLVGNNIPYPIAPVCRGGPDRVLDRSFSELQVDDFACRPVVRGDSRRVEAVSGGNASVVCRVESTPEAHISWYWNGRLLLNNSAFSSFQRVYVYESGRFQKKSTLILTNAQEADSGDFFCVAENRAGNAEGNYTLYVSPRLVGMATLNGGEIAGLSAALVVLILFILLAILLLLVRLRRMPFTTETKTPGRMDAVANGGSVIAAAGPDKVIVATPVTGVETSSFSERTKPNVPGELNLNPVQKPPRVPGEPPDSNPDLINDTKTRPDGEGEEVPGSVTQYLYPGGGTWEAVRGDGSSSNFCFDGSNDKTPIMDEDYSCRSAAPGGGGYPADYGLPILPTTSEGGSGGGSSPPPQHPSAKTLRVWQRGVPVLPPVTALKRVLSRNSPDEGYQEGCGTDV
ncbi:leucine-rich repeat-containing protein 4 [Nilaparvata lugens]|uniref:leucine-rich repeat-containing protein 4 n=1 Tax=Nilaparvata lugens TaxID=108931 RepID=UPI00193E9F7B|nr:leucine-rich repeat-containing protein 4 [Nilaparvata lugens]